MLRILALVALLLVAALPVSAGFKEGLAAFERSDYRTAYREWKPLAQQGDAAAQTSLGFMYANGWGVPKSDHEAAKWWRKAALQGNALAQYNLGFLYANGRGAPKNYVLAYMWWSLAALDGDKDAARKLDMLKKRMTPAQIAKAQEMAAKWRPKKARSTK